MQMMRNARQPCLPKAEGRGAFAAAPFSDPHLESLAGSYATIWAAWLIMAIAMGANTAHAATTA